MPEGCWSAQTTVSGPQAQQDHRWPDTAVIAMLSDTGSARAGGSPKAQPQAAKTRQATSNNDIPIIEGAV